VHDHEGHSRLSELPLFDRPYYDFLLVIRSSNVSVLHRYRDRPITTFAKFAVNTWLLKTLQSPPVSIIPLKLEATYALRFNYKHIIVKYLRQMNSSFRPRRGDNFHQVWSWYDHPLLTYSVRASDTLYNLVTLTFDFLTFVSGRTSRVTWSTAPPSFKIPISSWNFLSLKNSWVNVGLDRARGRACEDIHTYIHT